MVELLDCITRAMEQALSEGKGLDAARMTGEIAARQAFGGERVYISSLPKQRRAVQLAQMEKRTQIEMAQATGLSVRGIRKILRGR